jgi:hypothetical protein
LTLGKKKSNFSNINVIADSVNSIIGFNIE